MRVKNIVFGIKSLEHGLDEAKEVMKRLERGEPVKKRRPGIYFENLDIMRKALTDERLRILKVIKEEHPSFIYGLAKLLHRNLKNVSDDVRHLAALGLIELHQTKEARQKTTPLVNYDKILFEIAL